MVDPKVMDEFFRKLDFFCKKELRRDDPNEENRIWKELKEIYLLLITK